MAKWGSLLLAVYLAGCATTGNVSRGGSLLAGLHQYQSEMQQAGAQPSRWPDRQRAAGALKSVITGTVGASPEFYRLVDLDLRRREFTITMRETSLRPDRLKEMKEELESMNEEVAALRPVIKTQLTSLTPSNPADQIENLATLGLLGILLDGFGSPGARRAEASSTRVGQYTVTDLGTFATVRGPDGKSFRCNVFGTVDDGGGVRCEPGN